MVILSQTISDRNMQVCFYLPPLIYIPWQMNIKDQKGASK